MNNKDNVGYNKKYFFFFIILIILMFIWSLNIRHSQYKYWKTKKDIYFVERYPAMTTLDAYYWLRYAKEYDKGVYYKTDNDSLRYYPDQVPKEELIPLLSFLIAKFSGFTNSNYYYVALYILPFLASLFIIPLGLYFYYVGFPAGGLIGGFIGTFSYMYFVRTSMGRVDTDLLNIFFPVLASLFVFFAGYSKSDKKLYIYSSLAGLTMLFFYWWYFHPGFTIIYFIVLLVYLLVHKRNKKQIIYSLSLYILFSNPLFFYKGIYNLLGFIKKYFTISKEDVIGFPNVLQTITEAQHKPIMEVLNMIISYPILSVLGLVVFIGIAGYYWRKFLPIIPVFLLGVLAFKSSNRFVMFLAPFVGVGLGAIIDLVVKYFKRQKEEYVSYIQISVFAVAFVMMFFLKNITAYNYIPKPSIHPKIIKSFINMNKTLKNGPIWSWWDYGYAIEDIVGFPTYHDGGCQGGPKTYFIAKSLISNNQDLLYRYISYFDNNGMKEINQMLEDNISAPDILKKIDKWEGKPKVDTNYVLFTKDMIRKFAAFNFIGSYNFKTRKPKKVVLAVLQCQGMKNGVFSCQGNKIDLAKGLINGKIPIKRFVVSDNGYIKQKRKFNFKNGLNVEVVLRDNILYNMILSDDNFFFSNFNQMYLLGRYDKNLFEEVYNNFPFTRVFKVRK